MKILICRHLGDISSNISVNFDYWKYIKSDDVICISQLWATVQWWFRLSTPSCHSKNNKRTHERIARKSQRKKKITQHTNPKIKLCNLTLCLIHEDISHRSNIHKARGEKKISLLSAWARISWHTRHIAVYVGEPQWEEPDGYMRIGERWYFRGKSAASVRAYLHPNEITSDATHWGKRIYEGFSILSSLNISTSHLLIEIFLALKEKKKLPPRKKKRNIFIHQQPPHFPRAEFPLSHNEIIHSKRQSDAGCWLCECFAATRLMSMLVIVAPLTCTRTNTDKRFV